MGAAHSIIGKMRNAYNTCFAIKETRVHFQDPGDDGRSVFRETTKQIPLALITNSVWLTKLSLLECLTKHMHCFNTSLEGATGLNV
jgi:hypothetical protein